MKDREGFISRIVSVFNALENKATSWNKIVYEPSPPVYNAHSGEVIMRTDYQIRVLKSTGEFKAINNRGNKQAMNSADIKDFQGQILKQAFGEVLK